MSGGDLLRAIGQRGDSQWSRRLSDAHDGFYVMVDDPGPPYWSLLYRASKLNPDLFLAVAPLAALIDAAYWVVRAAVFPFFLTLWSAERGAARLLRRTFFCPLCFNPMTEPYVYCPRCGRVQGRLRPRIGSLLFKRCAGCGETRWRLIGNYLLNPPGPLVCRDTPQHTGCYRPHQLPNLAGRCSVERIALVGPSVASKHTLLAHLVNQMVNGSASRGSQYYPTGKLSTLEFQLMRQTLARSPHEPTDHCERPGRRYTLARTFALQGAHGKNVAVIHNVSNSWIRYEDRLFTDGLAWTGIRSLVFVIDAAVIEGNGSEGILSHVEVYSRLVRVIEKDLSLAPGSPLPLRVAIVLPLTSGANVAQPVHSNGTISAADVQRYVAQGAPALHALVQRTVAPGQLRYFGGLGSPKLDLSRSGWVRDVAGWVSSRS